MTDTATKPNKSTAEIVLSAVQDLFAREQIVTRETLAELTGLKLTTIDDRLGHLVDNGKIRRVQRGVFVPLEQHRPARPISRTLCPDGTTVLEVGDTVMILSPRGVFNDVVQIRSRDHFRRRPINSHDHERDRFNVVEIRFSSVFARLPVVRISREGRRTRD